MVKNQLVIRHFPTTENKQKIYPANFEEVFHTSPEQSTAEISRVYAFTLSGRDPEFRD